jgi:hypothetical protein
MRLKPEFIVQLINPLALANGNIKKKKKPEIKSCKGEYLLPSVSTDGTENQI